VYDAYRRVIGARSLILGGFFSEPALAAAVTGAVTRIEAVVAHSDVLVPVVHLLADDGLEALPFGATAG
jgi:hypothetical protein